jgi:hypothetical protein
MWVAQYILIETATEPVFVLREIVWPPDLEDRHELRRLAVATGMAKGQSGQPKRTFSPRPRWRQTRKTALYAPRLSERE